MALLHHVMVSEPAEVLHSPGSDIAAGLDGVDGVTRGMHADGLENRLTDLHGPLQEGLCRSNVITS